MLTSDIPTLNTLLIKGLHSCPIVTDITDSSDITDNNIADIADNSSIADIAPTGIDRPFIDQLYENLSRSAAINPLTMSFCVKILLNILKFDGDEVMRAMRRAGDDCMDVLLAHVDSNAVVHLFTEFVQCDDDVADARMMVRIS